MTPVLSASLENLIGKAGGLPGKIVAALEGESRVDQRAESNL